MMLRLNVREVTIASQKKKKMNSHGLVLPPMQQKQSNNFKTITTTGTNTRNSPLPDNKHNYTKSGRVSSMLE